MSEWKEGRLSAPPGSMNIGFLYYNFYPVQGGASVHGFHLAKELTQLGHKLYKLNGQADPFTEKLQQSPAGLMKMVRDSDLFYVRVDYFLNARNLAGLAAKIAGKKIVVELNSPSDELALRGRSESFVRMIDRAYSRLLKRASATITVSEPIKRYCQSELELENVHVVENGGEVFKPPTQEMIESSETVQRFQEIRDQADKVVVWAGSANKMQNFQLVKEVANRLDENAKLVLIVNEEPGTSIPEEFAEGAVILKNANRKEVGAIIAQSDVGIALYDEYPWSRWGFYNSSLKIYEFLNNGLLTVSNVPGSPIQTKYSNFSYIPDADLMAESINRFQPEDFTPENPRTWETVAKEVSTILKNVRR